MTGPATDASSPDPAGVGSPRLVIFDMDDVLVDYAVDARQAAMARLAGLTAAEVRRRIWQSGIEDAGDMGTLDADGYLTAVAKALDIPFGRTEWLATRALATRPRPDMTALAQRVGRRATLALLTNNGLVMKEHFDRLVPHLRPLFGERMHAAAEFRTKKPDPSIFTRLAALHGCAPGEAMMIDDKAGHIAGARRAGLHGHHFTGIEDLERALAQLHLI